MMLTALALLAVSVMSFSLMACSSDDDEPKNSDWPSTFTNKISYNGEVVDVKQAYYDEDEVGSVGYYVFSLFGDEGKRSFDVSIPKQLLNKKLDLTKDLRPSSTSPVTVFINSTYAYSDEAFSAGSTLIASFDGTNLKVYAKGRALKSGNFIDGGGMDIPAMAKIKFEPYDFEINYSGKPLKESVMPK